VTFAYPMPRLPKYLLLACLVRVVLAAHAMAVVDWHQTGDISFYYDLASLSDQGAYPFLHFWTEYPPLFPWLITGVYRVLQVLGFSAPQQFAYAFTSLFLGIELVNIALIYSLVRRARGARAARWASVVYASCPTLVCVSSGWFDPLAVLFTLSAVRALHSKRATTTGVLIALGILTKIFPGAVLLAVPITLGWRGARRVCIAMLATLSAVILPLALVRADLLLASAASMMTRGPWETLPAIASGYYGWGLQPPLEERFSAATAFAAHTTPRLLMLLPESILMLAIAAAVIALRQRLVQPQHVHVLVAIGVTTFLIGNKGFSPQFVSWLIPVVLLAWPNAIGLAYVALLSAHSLVYDYTVFPAMYGYYLDRNTTFAHMAAVVTLSVVVRTALMVWIAGHMFWEIARAGECLRPIVVPVRLRLAMSAR
jgi:4-amino-4-deoxy-L-arabinose transferase-like glycosyltransferase